MGKGSIQFDTASSRYLIELTFVADYDAVLAGHTLRWQRSVEWMSELLFAATGNQMQLGTVYFENAGTPTDEQDIVLVDYDGDSFTTGFNAAAFCGQITLYSHVMNEPLCAVHELGHYIGTLADEYRGYDRHCQNDPGTGECIMEFASGFSLLLDDAGNVATTQPLQVVSRFCSSGHPNTPAPLPTANGQQYRHRMSCWDTWQLLYPQLIATSENPSINSINPIQWIELGAVAKFALTVGASDMLASHAIAKSIKVAVKEWINRIASTGDQLTVVWQASGVVRAMSKIRPDEVAQLHQTVDELPVSQVHESDNLILKALGQYSNTFSATQRLILVEGGSPAYDTSIFPAQLPKKRVTLVAKTIGSGIFSQQLDSLEGSNKWIDQQNLPVSANDTPQYAFTIQNDLIESYFSNSPGYGLTELRWGSLPASSILNSPKPNKEPSIGNPIQSTSAVTLGFQLDSRGIDFPIWIEKGAESLSLLLSEPELSNIQLQLIAPDNKTTFVVPARAGLPIHAFDQTNDIGGRWFVRLRRLHGNTKLPFFFLAAVKNRRLRTALDIHVASEGVVRFRLQVIHTFPVDFMSVTVDILQLTPDESNGIRVQSLILHRQQAIEDNSMGTEVSSGIYRNSVRLQSGVYTAVVRATNHGQAVYASNPDGVLGGNIVSQVQDPIPPFSRIMRRRFRVN